MPRTNLKDPTHYRRNLPHILEPDAPHFVTFKTKEGFRLPEPARDIVFKHCLHDHNKRLYIHAFVIMPTHAHLLFTPLRDDFGDSYPLSKIMQGIKGTSARRVNLLLDQKGSLWQDESLDRVVRDNEYDKTVFYIIENPIAAGLAKVPDEYRWLWVNPAQPGEAVPHRYNMLPAR
ncbi:MAG TPA: transposase [Terriglobales bacterium]|nr:transposase [Terriglobales bacterium]